MRQGSMPAARSLRILSACVSISGFDTLVLLQVLIRWGESPDLPFRKADQVGAFACLLDAAGHALESSLIGVAPLRADSHLGGWHARANVFVIAPRPVPSVRRVRRILALPARKELVA